MPACASATNRSRRQTGRPAGRATERANTLTGRRHGLRTGWPVTACARATDGPAGDCLRACDQPDPPAGQTADRAKQTDRPAARNADGHAGRRRTKVAGGRCDGQNGCTVPTRMPMLAGAKNQRLRWQPFPTIKERAGGRAAGERSFGDSPRLQRTIVNDCQRPCLTFAHMHPLRGISSQSDQTAN